MMDKTKEYIQMCNTYYLMKLWTPQEGDFYYHCKDVHVLGCGSILGNTWRREGKKIMEVAVQEDIDVSYHLSDDFCLSTTVNMGNIRYKVMKVFNPVWLPRVDQLMEIANLDISSKIERLISLREKVVAKGQTFEQFFLSYLMCRDYGLYWDEVSIRWQPMIQEADNEYMVQGL
jgi:hypothetical protein